MTWLRRLFGRNRPDDRTLADELEAHRAFVEDELRRSGLSAAEAGTEARRRLGNVTLASEDSREVWTWRWLDLIRQYARYGARGLRREPLFALTAIVTLALGTAATTTVFSVVDAEVWRPLPYPDPHRLVSVRSRAATGRTDTDEISLDELLAWRRAPGLASMAAATEGRRATVQLDRAESLVVNGVTANYFTTLGRAALVGRVFADSDAHGERTALLTERGWTRVFDRDPGIVGRVLMLDSEPTTIVGVVADDESLALNPEIFLPLDERVTSGRPGPVVYGGIGRLADGATADSVRAQVQTIVTERVAIDPERRGHVVLVEDLSSFYSPLDHRSLYFFLGASALVLLLTVVNTAALVLSRMLRRAPEFALRGALGGDARAIAAQLIVEAVLVVLPACVVGFWLTSQALAVAGAVVPDDFLYRGSHIPLDLRAVFCSLGIALATTAGLAVVPMSLARRVGSAAIGAGARTGSRPAAGRTRTVLLTAQLALTVVLLAGAGLFLESFVALLHVPLGFDPTSAWSARVALNGPRYAGESERRGYADALLDRARAIPGVRSAGVATSSPLGSGWLAYAHDARRPVLPSNAGDVSTIYRAVGGDYFTATGTRIVRGRPVGPADAANSPAVAVVNQQFAQMMFPEEDSIGRTVTLTPTRGPGITGGSVTIVGVAANIKEISPNEVAFADIYVPFAQHPAPALELLVRGTGDASMASALRAAAAAVDPTMPVTSTTTLTSRVTKSTKGARFNLTLVAGFATVALLVAAIGIYGAMAYAATARWREYGVRLALGATPRGLLGRALWQSTKIGLSGGLFGIVGALLFARWLGDALYLVPTKHSGLLYNVKTSDPLALGGALVGVVVLAVLAGAVPARRVSKIDPVSALRAE